MRFSQFRRPMAKLPTRIRRRLRRVMAGYLPPPGRLPADWFERVAPHTGSRTWRDHFAGARNCTWMWTRRDREQIVTHILNHRPETKDRVQRRADRHRERYLSILGFGEVAVPVHHDWSYDLISGRRWPMVRAERVPLIFPDKRSDMKHVWEPARFHFAPTLGAAYALTGSVEYAKSFRGWVDDFIAGNPYGYGIQWTNPMEVAIRALNWIVGWQWCCDSVCFDETFTRRWIGSLIAHGRFLAANLECTRRGINTNHYIADLVGLYAIATFLPEWPESCSWRRTALTELLEEVQSQVLPDGFCYESSFAYQRLTFEMWAFFWILATRQGEDGLEPLTTALNRMAEFSSWIADDHGHVPPVGDGDDGRFVFWEPRDPTDHTPIFRLARAALPEAVLRPIHRLSGNTDDDTIWLIGPGRLDDSRHTIPSGTRNRVPFDLRTETRVFPDAQVAVLRSDRWLVHVLANPVGTGGIGGHKHNDLLSFTASCDGVPVIVDPGTYAYTADPVLRNRMRGTAAHATVMIDGAEQNRFVPGQLFCLWQDAQPEIAGFDDDGVRARIAMRHDGYTRLRHPVMVERELVLDRQHETLVITDRLVGEGTHRIDLTFPLGDLSARMIATTAVELVESGRRRVTLRAQSRVPWRLSVEPAWRSHAYGTKSGHRRLVFRADTALPAMWTTTLTAGPVPEYTKESERIETGHSQISAVTATVA